MILFHTECRYPRRDYEGKMTEGVVFLIEKDMQKEITPLSSRSKAIILGSLLGDGSLKVHRPYKNARFSFRHSITQEEYFLWKVKELVEISSKISVWKQSKDGKDGWGTVKLRYQSGAQPSLTELYHLTHKGGEKGRIRIRRKWLNMLTPLSLAIWWCDDGSLVSDSRQGVLCTDGFSLKDIHILDRYMKKVWGITTKIVQVKNTEQYRLWIRSSHDLQKFLHIILPYLPVASMLPKVLMLYRDSQLQQRWISEVVKLSQFSLEIVEYYLKQKKAKWKRYRSENDIVQSL